MSKKSIPLTRKEMLNRQIGSMKRTFKMKGDIKPGDFISKMNVRDINNNKKTISKTRLSIMGLV